MVHKKPLTFRNNTASTAIYIARARVDPRCSQQTCHRPNQPHQTFTS